MWYHWTFSVGDTTFWLLQVVALIGFHFRHCWKQLKNRVQAAGCVSVYIYQHSLSALNVAQWMESATPRQGELWSGTDGSSFAHISWLWTCLIRGRMTCQCSRRDVEVHSAQPHRRVRGGGLKRVILCAFPCQCVVTDLIPTSSTWCKAHTATAVYWVGEGGHRGKSYQIHFISI